MYSTHETITAGRTSVQRRDAQQLRIARELAAARRWHRVQLRAWAATRRACAVQRRHARRAAG